MSHSHLVFSFTLVYNLVLDYLAFALFSSTDTYDRDRENVKRNPTEMQFDIVQNQITNQGWKLLL